MVINWWFSLWIKWAIIWGFPVTSDVQLIICKVWATRALRLMNRTCNEKVDSNVVGHGWLTISYGWATYMSDERLTKGLEWAALKWPEVDNDILTDCQRWVVLVRQVMEWPEMGGSYIARDGWPPFGYEGGSWIEFYSCPPRSPGPVTWQKRGEKGDRLSIMTGRQDTKYFTRNTKIAQVKEIPP